MGALVPDDLWAVIAPVLPRESEKPKGARPRTSDRAALAGIILDLCIGYAVEALAAFRSGPQRQDELATAWSMAGGWRLGRPAARDAGAASGR